MIESLTLAIDLLHHGGTSSITVAPLLERIDALNHSIDPWECTEAAPQAGRTTSGSRSYLFKATSSYDLRMLLLSSPLGLLI